MKPLTPSARFYGGNAAFQLFCAVVVMPACWPVGLLFFVGTGLFGYGAYVGQRAGR